MIQIQRNEAMSKASERAKAHHPKVSIISASQRVYTVKGSKGDTYVVRFEVINGRKLASCECKAGERGSLCYHVAAAAAVNIGIQAMRAAVAKQAAQPAQCAHTHKGTSARGGYSFNGFDVDDDIEEFVYCRDCGAELA
jgi:hypothetical protein